MKNKLQCQFELEKTQIVIFKSTIDRARDLFKFLENKNKKDIDPITRAKKILYILESLER